MRSDDDGDRDNGGELSFAILSSAIHFNLGQMKRKRFRVAEEHPVEANGAQYEYYIDIQAGLYE